VLVRGQRLAAERCDEVVAEDLRLAYGVLGARAGELARPLRQVGTAALSPAVQWPGSPSTCSSAVALSRPRSSIGQARGLLEDRVRLDPGRPHEGARVELLPVREHDVPVDA
jgi:hypothetical protein